MIKKSYQLEYEKVEPIAMEYFLEASGLGGNAPTHKALLNEAIHVLKMCKEGAEIKGTVIELKKESFKDSKVYLGNSNFACTAFEQIPEEKINKVYAYILSLEKCEFQSKNQAEQYYADLWGSCFLKAGREILKEQIYESEKIYTSGYYISDSIGPGTYGMNLDRQSDMEAEICGGKLCVHASAEELTRSCCGFFFITTEMDYLPSIECRDCIGHEKGCLFCDGKNITPSRKTCLVLLETYGTPPHVIRHCLAVTEAALKMAKALIKKGETLDLELLEASSLLHDIARVEENHGVKGAIVLEKHGYHQVAKLVRCHMFYATDPNKDSISEQDLLCLADRMVKEDRYVGLENRMQYVLDKLKAKGIDTKKVYQRLEENRRIRDKIEQIIGKSIDELML